MARCYAKSNGVVERQIRGERILVPIAGSMDRLDSIYALNDVASFVCGKAFEGASEDDIISAVTSQYQVDPKTATADVRRILTELLAIGALTPVGQA
jgi:hypothetical protein